VQEEAIEELEGWQTHGLALIGVGAIAPGEANAAVLEGEQALVGDGDALHVAAEVVEDLLGAGEGVLGVDDPGLGAKRSEEGASCGRFGEGGGGAGQAQFVLGERAGQGGEELGAEDL